MSTHGAAHYLRHELATALRRNPYQTNLLLAGFEEEVGPSLYFIDYLSSMQKVPYGAHGYGSYFSLSILDRYFNKEMDVKDGLKLLKKCIDEIQTRLLLNTPQFIVKIADKNGTREIALDSVSLDDDEEQVETGDKMVE